MKTIIHSSILLALASSGIAFGAATATTIPVGYETLALSSGFNFDGIRLQNTPIATGILDAATVSTVTDNDIDLGALITSGTYILELTNGSGIIQEVTSATGTALNVAANLTAQMPASYKLRTADTMESVFGSAYTGSPDFGVTNGTLNSGLTIGYGSTVGADQIWIWNGTDFTEYYFDEFGEPYGPGGFNGPGWVNLDSSATPIDPSTINLIYADSFIVSSSSGNDVVVSGEVKKHSTELNLVSGFNFVGSVAPAGANLESAFGTTYTGSPDFGVTNGALSSGLKIGYGSTVGADQVWIWNGIDFTEYYFDEFGEPYGPGGFNGPGWVNLDSSATPITPSLISLPSGYIISAAGPNNVVQGVPSYYSGL